MAHFTLISVEVNSSPVRRFRSFLVPRLRTVRSLLVSDTLDLSNVAYFKSSLKLRLSEVDSEDQSMVRQADDKWWVESSTDVNQDSAYAIWTYRVLLVPINEVYAQLDSIRLMNERPIEQLFEEGQGISIGDIKSELGAVDYRGSFGRGLRFGNSQNLVLDSRLDLQLNGDLGGGLSVAAVVSDQNIPLQPEGNTVQLQEFDKLFVTVTKDKHSLTAGDYSLRSDQGHFLRFDKNLQGLNYRFGSAEDNTRSSIGAAAARGQFNRTQISLTDGNQGPYRLIA